MKIFIITKEKKVIEKNADSKEQYYFFNKCAYKLDGNCVRLTFKDNHVNPEAILFFVEGDPLPINVTDEARKEAMSLFDEEVLKNAIENVTKIKGEGFGGFFWKIIDTISNPKVITAMVVLGIAGLIIYSVLTGGLTIG